MTSVRRAQQHAHARRQVRVGSISTAALLSSAEATWQSLAAAREERSPYFTTAVGEGYFLNFLRDCRLLPSSLSYTMLHGVFLQHCVHKRVCTVPARCNSYEASGPGLRGALVFAHAMHCSYVVSVASTGGGGLRRVVGAGRG